MSHAISLKINDNVFKEEEEIVKQLNISRNFYINNAIDFYNKAVKRNFKKKQYLNESRLVCKESLDINKEFQDIEDEILGL